MRLDNGTLARADGKGEAWANEHREALGSNYYLQDLDGLFGLNVWGHNTGNRFFLEYVPDSWENKGRVCREFGVVALFDRKSSIETAQHTRNTLSLAFYLYLCRTHRSMQPDSLAPRFFYVCGDDDEPPWHMYEVDIDTGLRVGAPVELSARGDWMPAWKELGLVALRAALRQYVESDQSVNKKQTPPRPPQTIARAKTPPPPRGPIPTAKPAVLGRQSELFGGNGR